MSKKVLFYMTLDLIGIGITLLARAGLCNLVYSQLSDQFICTILTLAVNIASIGICLFIVFFFLLYWWSDKKWTNIKQRFKKKR